MKKTIITLTTVLAFTSIASSALAGNNGGRNFTQTQTGMEKVYTTVYNPRTQQLENHDVSSKSYKQFVVEQEFRNFEDTTDLQELRTWGKENL